MFIMKITLKDIAEKAGVSISTVSYALNRRGRVTKEKHKEILEIVDEYNYVPDANARGLVTGITNNIGLLISKDTDAIFQQPFVMKCISEFSRYLQKHSGWLSMCMTGDMEVDTMRGYLANANFDGIIFLFAEYTDDLVRLMQVRRIPCVFFDSWTKCEQVADIACDEDLGIKMAVDHLVSLGHSRILFLSAKPLNADRMGDIRQNVYRKAIHDHQLNYQKILYTGFEKQAICEQMKNCFQEENKPTAIVTPSDKIAWGAIDYLQENNIKVPEDVSVIGYDDADVVQNEEYKLTTIQQPVRDMVKASVDYIYKCHETKELNSIRERHVPTLLIRGTTGRCKDIYNKL